jgi:glycolate oxidase
MALTRDLYQAVEQIVGAKNVSDEPVILDSYAWRSGLGAADKRFVQRFEAIVLPGGTTEVQAIVRLCNREGLRYKASSTGWGFMSDPGGPGVVKIDLRRMNRILEINEEDMYAVVEPYVIGAQLQAELMKRGLTCNVTGAGGNCSALPLAAHEGIGHMGQSLSYGERNQLALEWVTPDGEVVRLGSLGSTGSWFCGDGPGPSLRGVIRGHTTPLGGLGVFTAAAQKIYHWPGPSTVPVQGCSPNYVPKLPAGFVIRYLSFPSPEARFEAMRKIGESEIAAEIMGFTASMVAANMATSNDEDACLDSRLRASVQGPGFQVVVMGDSHRDYEYKTKVLDAIMRETGAVSLPVLEDPDTGAAMLWRCVRITGSIRETLRATGAFGGVVGGTDQVELLAEYIAAAAERKADLIHRGLALDDGSEPFVTSLEHGHFGHAELLVRHEPGPEAGPAIGELMSEAVRIGATHRLGVPHFVGGDELHDVFGPLSSNYHLWLRGLKRVLDPNQASEANNYVTYESERKAGHGQR